MEIAFEEKVPGLSPKDLSFMISALDIQMREHFAPRWLEKPWPVRCYTSLAGLPVGTFWPVAILPDIGDGALGYHNFLNGLCYGRIRWTDFVTSSVTASHEALELRMDPLCNRWVPIGGDELVALELCDPCEGDQYVVRVGLFGETRDVWVSDFVLPSYFVKGAPRPYTFLDTIDKNVFEKGLSRNGGGYLLIQDASGNVIDYWGKKNFGFSRVKAPRGWSKKDDILSRVSKRKSGQIAEILDLTPKIKAA